MGLKKFKLSNRLIGAGRPVFIIAEIGVNHNGSLKLAKKLIEAAKAAGADAVKFQTFSADELATKNTRQAAYQKKNSRAASQHAMLKQLELSHEQFRALRDHCRRRNVLFLSTPFDRPSAAFLAGLGVPAFKISSGDLTNAPLLAQIAGYGKPIILSTGMADLAEVKEAVKIISRAGNRQLVLLHCTSNYPAAYADLNLRAIQTLRNGLAVPVGYSDHSEGVAASVAAVALGACVIEKHFTLDNSLPGPDHKASLEPAAFAALVKTIRQTESALGDGRKSVRRSELPVRAVARKSVVALVDLAKGDMIRAGMLAVKRPGNGIAPKYLDQLTGRRLKQPVKRDTALTWSVLS